MSDEKWESETLEERRARAAERNRQEAVNADLDRRIEMHVGNGSGKGVEPCPGAEPCEDHPRVVSDEAKEKWVAERIAKTKRLDQDLVNSPPHYQANGFEAIEIIEAFDLGFNLGNAVKYILRAGRKGGPEKRREDLEKASWYLRRELGDR